MMSLEAIERRFSSYLRESWELSDVAPFLLAYIQLLLMFQDELSPAKLDVLRERQKKLLEGSFKDERLNDKDERFNELKASVRREMDRNLRNDVSMSREDALNRLLFCAVLDTAENDFFYLTEPMFEFARKMEVTPDQMKRILESEFAGLQLESKGTE